MYNWIGNNPNIVSNKKNTRGSKRFSNDRKTIELTIRLKMIQRLSKENTREKVARFFKIVVQLILVWNDQNEIDLIGKYPKKTQRLCQNRLKVL